MAANAAAQKLFGADGSDAARLEVAEARAVAARAAHADAKERVRAAAVLEPRDSIEVHARPEPEPDVLAARASARLQKCKAACKEVCCAAQVVGSVILLYLIGIPCYIIAALIDIFSAFIFPYESDRTDLFGSQMCPYWEWELWDDFRG
jgi:hypothetical protein